MIRQHGIAYSAYGDPSIRDQHLQLDPFPHLVGSSDWGMLQQALAQRATLLNLLLSDLYGPRTLLTDGVLPLDLLFQHPHYQLPYHGLPLPGEKYLHFCAIELVRSPAGRWWIKGDRTDSPSGAGFALENRIAISKAFPDTFRQANVHRLSPYFMALKNHLSSLAKTNRDNPHIAVLSEGEGSERYFEDAFLARYLGFTLVETNDLVVRSGRVMLKTLAGLVQVDVLFRRYPSHSLDPLELGGGAPGIPGILQIIRDGNVVVANAPGSGLVESPIFMAFMPRICKALLGTDLKLPGIATWWGGEPASLELMLDRVHELQLVPAYRVRSLRDGRTTHVGPRFAKAKSLRTETMTRDERISLLRSDPTLWVAQEKIARSSSAVWDAGQVRSGHLTLRTFLTAKEDSWQVMPGGLVRVSEHPYESRQDASSQGGTKDAWVQDHQKVVGQRQAEPVSLQKKPGELPKLNRGRGFLPSRIADNLYWLGRYLSRADAGARLLRSVAARLTGETTAGEMVELPMLIRALAMSGQIDAGYSIQAFQGKLPPLEISLAAKALDRNDSDSIRFQLDRIFSLTASVRDRLSTDAWRIIQEMNTSFTSSSPENCDLVDLLDIIDTLVVGLAAFSGFVSESMTRTHGFHFLKIGRSLEHSLQITQLINHCLVRDSVPNELLEAVLEVSESRLTYRSRYYANLQLPMVLDLLLADQDNPRSLKFQLQQLADNLSVLPVSSGGVAAIDRTLAEDAQQAIEAVNLLEIGDVGIDDDRLMLSDLLDSIETCLPMISTSISNRFFVHSGPAHQIVSEAPN